MSPSELFLECVLKISTLFSHTGCQTISPLVDSIVNDLLLEFVRNSTLGLLFIYTVNIHDVQCDALFMDVITDEEPLN